MTTVLQSTRSGGASINDAAFHVPTLEFGGVGESGHGAYRGKASFDTFVHRRAVTSTPNWLESVITIRYPPYAGKLAKFRAASEQTPDFDREGRKIRFRLLRTILTLGGGTAKAGAGRAAVLAISKSIPMPVFLCRCHFNFIFSIASLVWDFLQILLLPILG